MEIKIKDVPVIDTVKGDDKLPISVNDNEAHTITMTKIKEYCGNGTLTRVTWDEIQGKPDFKPISTSGNYNDLNNTPIIPSKTSDLQNTSGFTTLEEVNKEVDLKGFLTRKEAENTFTALPKMIEIDAEPITQLTIQKGNTYLINCSSGVVEKIELMNFVNDFEDIKIYIKNVSKPIQLSFPKSATFLTPMPQTINEREEAQIIINLNYIKYFGTGSAIM